MIQVNQSIFDGRFIYV